MIDCDSAKEMIDSLFSRLDQQQPILDRFGDIEAELARQIARNRQLKTKLQELCTSAFPFETFVQVKYDTLRARL